MSTIDYTRLRELYHELCERPPEEWRPAVEELGLEDDQRLELIGLLEEDVDSGAFADGQLGAMGRQLVGGWADSETLPEAIGPYRVMRKIGEGGMGVVYAARESEGDLVAVKVIRSEVGSTELSKRFEREVEVLRNLRHPGIAAFLGAGHTRVTDGPGAKPVPFLVMEYVEGESLLDYARRRGLGDRERLELIARIADALQHAHDRGVVHRDLKPGNLLVLVLDRLERERLRILGEGVGSDRARPRRELLVEGRVRCVGDDDEPFRNGRADAARMIEVVVRVHQVGQRLIRDELPRLGDHRQRSDFVGRLDEHQVVAELDENAVVRLAGQEPDAVGHFLGRHVGGWRPSNRCRGCRRIRGGEIAHVSVHALSRHAQIDDLIIVRRHDHARRQHQPVHVLVVSEARPLRDVAQVRVVQPRRHVTR